MPFETPTVKYGFGFIVDTPDSNELSKVESLLADIDNQLDKRDLQTDADGDTWYGEYRLKGVQTRVDLYIYMMIGPNASQNIRDENAKGVEGTLYLDNMSEIIIAPGTPRTYEEMETQLKTKMRQNGVSKFWIINYSDKVRGNIVNKFKNL